MSSKGTCRTLNLLNCSTLPCRNVSMSFKSTCNVKAAFDIRHFKCKGSLAYNMLAQQHDVVRPDAARTRTLELQLLGHVLQHSPTKTYMCTAIGIEVIGLCFFRPHSKSICHGRITVAIEPDVAQITEHCRASV